MLSPDENSSEKHVYKVQLKISVVIKLNHKNILCLRSFYLLFNPVLYDHNTCQYISSFILRSFSKRHVKMFWSALSKCDFYPQKEPFLPCPWPKIFEKYWVCLVMIKVFNNVHKWKVASISLQIQFNHKGSWQYKFVTNWAIQEAILMNAMKHRDHLWMELKNTPVVSRQW